MEGPNGPASGSSVEQRCQEAKSKLADNMSLHKPAKDYKAQRNKLITDEQGGSWDAPARLRASSAELEAQKIVFKIREYERKDKELFGNIPGEAVPDKQSHDMGGRFLTNIPSIEASRVYQIACQMPKGGHQHLHFNSEIHPDYLFPNARNLKDTFFVRSTRPLCQERDFEETEIVFNVLPKETEHANIFSRNYNADWKSQNSSPWMLWETFRERFPRDTFVATPIKERTLDLDLAECWAKEKMVISGERAYSQDQTLNGAWACFNQGTRAFKGLVGYEGIYRWYVGAAIDSMIHDNVMYAELRPMLMDKTIPSNDGTHQLNLKEQMKIICEEVDKKKDQLEKEGLLHKFPFGLKIIYCAPRSILKQRMQTELEDCLQLKLQFPDLICGFDLVGAEDRPNCISFYADLLVAFTKTCKSMGISIPFMFHAGETLLDTGGSHNPENSNLYDSLLLNAKRIGHGYALLKHPLLAEKYKKQNICLELCPISNEVLHLCGNAKEHPFPQLLANGLHCTLNADNPSLFR